MATVDKQGVRIEYVPLGELRRWPRNPKGHDLGTLHESYDRFGYVMPMLVDERTGRLAVGHGRLDALQQRKAAGREAPGGIRASDGMWSVPVVRGVSFEDDAEMDAYVIADNRLTEVGGWDEPGLAAILADLAVEDEGLRGVGFDKDDLDALLASLASEPEPDPGAQVDKAAELQEKWQVQTGDLWEIGAHRLACGDCTDGEVVGRVMGGKRAGMVWSDPPYGKGGYAGRGGKLQAVVGDDADDATIQSFMRQGEAPEVYVCCDWETYRHLLAARGKPRSLIVWAKQIFGMGNGYRRQHEFIGYYGAFSSTSESDLWEIARGGAYVHPTQKPVELPERAIRNSCKRGDIVFDPFLGSGTAMAACEQLRRRCFGVEIHAPYVSVCLERLSQMGLEPRRVE